MCLRWLRQKAKKIKPRVEVIEMDELFSFKERKEVLEKSAEYEIILVDATETPIERPKKTKTILLRKEKEAYTKNIISY